MTTRHRADPDAAIRRARRHAAAGHLLSAAVDVQSAVLAVFDPRPSPPTGSARSAAARVLALAAQIQHDLGADPDLVASAADHALRAFADLPPHLRDGDPAARGTAATLSHRIHRASGHPAQAAPQTAAPPDPARDIRTWPTLAAVLAERGHDRRRTPLAVRPAPPVPALRADPRFRGAAGDLLACLRDGSDPAADLMLALEAHALFAAAPGNGAARSGRVWADLLLSVGRQADDPGLARDAAHWLADVLDRLAPYTDVDAAVRATTTDARRWIGEVSDPVVKAGGSASVQKHSCKSFIFTVSI